MEELQIDWEQECPNPKQINEIWNSIKIIPLNNWTKSTAILIEKISYTHINGGIQLHKFKIESSDFINWFASRNRLNEINFLINIINHTSLSEYRSNLQIVDNNFELLDNCSDGRNSSDIYYLPGELARIMGIGGAYNNIDTALAWKTATDFVRYEFQNRFEEFCSFETNTKVSNWFWNISWDYSYAIFDKRNNELIFIDITDTD